MELGPSDCVVKHLLCRICLLQRAMYGDDNSNSLIKLAQAEAPDSLAVVVKSSGYSNLHLIWQFRHTHGSTVINKTEEHTVAPLKSVTLDLQLKWQ